MSAIGELILKWSTQHYRDDAYKFSINQSEHVELPFTRPKACIPAAEV